MHPGFANLDFVHSVVNFKLMWYSGMFALRADRAYVIDEDFAKAARKVCVSFILAKYAPLYSEYLNKDSVNVEWRERANRVYFKNDCVYVCCVQRWRMLTLFVTKNNSMKRIYRINRNVMRMSCEETSIREFSIKTH